MNRKVTVIGIRKSSASSLNPQGKGSLIRRMSRLLDEEPVRLARLRVYDDIWFYHSMVIEDMTHQIVLPLLGRERKVRYYGQYEGNAILGFTVSRWRALLRAPGKHDHDFNSCIYFAVLDAIADWREKVPRLHGHKRLRSDLLFVVIRWIPNVDRPSGSKEGVYFTSPFVEVIGHGV
jgi:hypothetical protein